MWVLYNLRSVTFVHNGKNLKTSTIVFLRRHTSEVAWEEIEIWTNLNACTKANFEVRFFWPENFSYEILLRNLMFHLSTISCAAVTKTNPLGVHNSYFCCVPTGFKWIKLPNSRFSNKYFFSLMNFTHAVLNIWLQDSILTMMF